MRVFASERLAVVGGVPDPVRSERVHRVGLETAVCRAEEHAGYVEICEARRLARSHQVRSEGDLRLGSEGSGSMSRTYLNMRVNTDARVGFNGSRSRSTRSCRLDMAKRGL